MRLIDADEFNKQEVLEKLRTAEFDDEIKDAVEKIPATYDADKVIERLMCESINCHIMTDRAIEIVKSGGVSDD